jgi:hypothetical protein
MKVKRYTAVAILLALGPMLGSCSGFAGTVADNWPHWAGGMPADVPPRPGAPGYEEFIAHGEAVQEPTNSITSGPSGASDATTAGGVPVKFQQIPAPNATNQNATKESTQNNEAPPKKQVARAAKKPVQNTQVARAAKKTVQNAQAGNAPPVPVNDNQSSPNPGVGSGGLY